MRCAASFLLSQSTPAAASAPAEASSAPLRLVESVGSQRQRRDQQWPCALPDALRDDHGSAVVNAAEDCVVNERSRSPAARNRAPRPVTARQLARAVLGLSGTSRAPFVEHSVCEIDGALNYSAGGVRRSVPDAVHAARLGANTIALDGMPCHRVLLCGRVVRCVDAYSNGSAAAAAASACGAVPHDLVWISDATGMVCVLRPRPVLNRSDAWLDVTHGARWPAAGTHSANTDARDCGSDSSARAAARAHGGGADAHCAVTDAAAPAGLLERDVDAAFATARGGAVPAAVCATEASLTESIDDVPCSVNDYVVCIGSLAFADVDGVVRHALERDGDVVRRATWAAAVACRRCDSTPPSHGMAHRGLTEDNASFTTSLEWKPPPCYVLLPGSEAPLTLEAAREELGVVGALPPSTRYLSAAEAAQWASSRSNVLTDAMRQAPQASTAAAGTLAARAASVVHPADPFTQRATTSVAPLQCNDDGTGLTAEWDAVPVFAIRGPVRVVLDTNECAFWWLSAVETHMRLAARAPHPSPPG